MSWFREGIGAGNDGIGVAAWPGGSRQCAESFEPTGTCTGRKKFERSEYWKQEFRNGAKRLNGCNPPASCARAKRRPKDLPRRSRRAKAGWTPERRARQAELIRQWAPWRHSTGPKTEAGKERCSKNALRHGGRSRAHIRELQRIRYALRLAAENISKARLLIRLRESAARPRIKYKPQYAHLSGRFPWREPGTHAMLRANRSGGETCVLWQL